MVTMVTNLFSGDRMKTASTGSFGTQWFLKMNPDKQDTLIKLSVLTMAAILCTYTII